jgi:hypothetical protein
MITRLVTWVRARRLQPRDDLGMTLSELLIASTLMIVLLTVVIITMSLFDNVATSVSSQYQELDQALPALAPLQSLLRAEVEPAPPTASGVPTPGFGMVGSASATITNYSLTFYSNIGTAYNNVTTSGTSAGPAMIVAEAISSTGAVVSSSSTCTISAPCSFQVREYLPQTTSGASTCPSTTVQATPAVYCQYPSTYKLITDAQNVVNNVPIFSYNIFDPNLTTAGTAYTLMTSEVQNNSITLSSHGYASSGYKTTQALSGSGSCVASSSTSPPYQTAAAACPADNIQSVGIDLVIGVKGAALPSGTSNYQNTVDNQTIVYRYPASSGATTYPYQYSATVG